MTWNSRQLRIAAVPPFLHLRRFAEGRGFKQWTGDDSKALMKVNDLVTIKYTNTDSLKVYLPAIYGIILVPDDMVRAIRAFLDFCYLVRWNIINTHCLSKIDNALAWFRHYHEIFVITGVRPDGISLPRQHSVFHYPDLKYWPSCAGSALTPCLSLGIVNCVGSPWARAWHWVLPPISMREDWNC